MWRLSVLAIVATLSAADSQNFATQVHISLTSDPAEMMVTWSTPSVDRSRVAYGLARGFPQNQIIADGDCTMFVDNGTLHHTQYIHRVVLTGLLPQEKYVYRVWNATSFSDVLYHFTHVGECRGGTSDIIVHVGDFAYDMDVDNATLGDRWLESIEPLASSCPYMVCPGNHEGMYDFLNYRSRFSMPMREEYSNLFFSWNAGLTHWISYDTEVYFVYDAMEGHGGIHRNFGPYPEVAKAQLAFIEADLQRANQDRAVRPWIVAYGHRPMYCSDNDDEDCVKMLDLWKKDLEDLYYKYGVDLVLEAHQHSYERLWPTYNGTVFNGTVDPYADASAPVHIVSGSAGCQEDLQSFGPPMGPWSAVRISDYGYGHLTVYNSTHMHWEQLRVTDFEIADQIWISKSHLYPQFATHAAKNNSSPSTIQSIGVIGWVAMGAGFLVLVAAAVYQLKFSQSDKSLYHTI